MIYVDVNTSVILSILASDGSTGLFPQIKIYNSAGGLEATIAATHVANGLYQANWVPANQGYFNYVAQFFANAGFTIDAGYDRIGDLIDVGSTKAQMARLLGLHNENTVIDNQVYDSQQKLLSARIRTYNSKANAQASGAVGLVASYTVSAAYTSDLLTNFIVVRDV